MALPIEDYALIGDRHTAALVGKNGSIDWLCLPRFDSPACFAALLGDESHGFWQLSPTTEFESSRRYVDDSAALETTFTTADGEVTLLDVMPTGDDRSDVVRDRHRRPRAPCGCGTSGWSASTTASSSPGYVDARSTVRRRSPPWPAPTS